ncbi:MAG: pilus assembly PilX N-terminal domain-containing protein [Moritella sp.]|uniref:pilus assembly PilX family protein n=1 Tax=Moritella sp. TaxID=78556 RepID=UPI0029AEEC9A|nr:pilus assembly PilX N-terminal domain-containing protein [Moritella sp.]MDX2320634.1 pilus assembly PilX N-terminal domain-containing protein [Moritella sp.]
MSLNRRPSCYPQQQGSMLVISLFILVVISLLAASLSRILSSTADSVANEVYSAKAYYASDSGMEYGIYSALNNSLTCVEFPLKPLPIPFDISGESGLENCSVSIDCQTIGLPNGSKQYYLTSTGTCDGGKIVAEHKVEAEVKS